MVVCGGLVMVVCSGLVMVVCGGVSNGCVWWCE